MTPRQKQVLDWIQKGASNKHIAQRLGITESTVKIHVTALLKKYAVKSRQQLALYSLNNITPTLPKLEKRPFAWVKTTNNYTGITFNNPQSDDWVPVYKKV